MDMDEDRDKPDSSRSQSRIDKETGSGSSKARRRSKSRSNSDKGMRRRKGLEKSRSKSRSGHRRSNRSLEGSRSAAGSDKRSPSTKPTVDSTELTTGEDVEALDFDPNVSISRRSSRKSLKDDPNYVEEPMQENIFSLMYISPVNSGGFWFALIVALLQIGLPLLAILDLLVLNDDEGNYLQLPNNVSGLVRATSFIVLILAVVQFWDLMEALEKLQNGPPPSRSDTPEGARSWKFYLSYSMQTVMGALFEVAVFLFIMQSTTIIEIFLDFAALEFVVNVDEFAFMLAKRGYITNAVKESCEEVCEAKILRRKGGRICRRLLMIFFGILMLTGWVVVASLQDNGRIGCEKAEVQFGDGFITILPVFSGIYIYDKQNQKEDDKRLGRPVYWDERRGAAFRYCRKGDSSIFSFVNTGFWVFNIIHDDVKTIDDMCDNFISRSPETKGYDLLEFPGKAWETKRRLKDTVQYNTDFFQLRCADCQEETCNGQCVNGQCVCNINQRGFNCQFTEKECEKTDYDRRTKPFRGVGEEFSSKYSLMKKSNGSTLYSYNRPVYYFVHTSGYVDLLINFGRRFFIFDILGFNINGALKGYDENQNPIIDTSIIADNFTSFHPWYSWIKPKYADNRTGDREVYRRPVFVSDPIDVGTQTDSLSPLGLRWKRIKSLNMSEANYFELFLIGSSIDTVLLCSRCSKTSPCLNNGICLSNNNTCQCPSAETFDDDDFFDNYPLDFVYSGPLCEVDCTEDFPKSLLNEACQAEFDPWADDDDWSFDDIFFDDDTDDDTDDGDDDDGVTNGVADDDGR